MNNKKWVALLALPSAFLAGEDARAESEVFFEISTRGVAAQRDVFESDDFDSSGIGADARIYYERENENGPFRFWVDGSIGVFGYFDDSRPTRETFRGELGGAYQIGDTIELSLELANSENLVVVESLQADQQRARFQGQWGQGNDRVRIQTEYRRRQYDQGLEADGSGMRYSAEYNRRFGSYHWLRFKVVQDSIDSNDDRRREYNRVSGSIDYSRPIARLLRLRTGVDFRSWNFPGRIARGDPERDRREDKFVAPEIGLNYGSSRGGWFGSASASYQFRTSNDQRFTGDTPRFSAEIGYRF